MPLLSSTFPSGAKITIMKINNDVFRRKASVLVGTQTVDMSFFNTRLGLPYRFTETCEYYLTSQLVIPQEGDFHHCQEPGISKEDAPPAPGLVFQGPYRNLGRLPWRQASSCNRAVGSIMLYSSTEASRIRD